MPGSDGLSCVLDTWGGFESAGTWRWEREAFRQTHGDPSSPPEVYFICGGDHPRLESHICLIDVPTVHSSSSRIGASGWLGTCHAPYIPRGVPASSEFGKHHR